jgi:hypothetical protein
MRTNDRALKRAYRSHIQSRPAPDGKSCPSPEEIWRMLVKRRRRKNKARMMDHITSCSTCYGEFEAFLEIYRAERDLAGRVEGTPSISPETRRFSWAWRYVSAVLLLLVIAGSVIFSTRWLNLAKKHSERGRLSGQLRLIAPGTRRSLRPPLIFRWEGIAGVEYYAVEIFDNSLLPVWKSSQTVRNSCEVPRSVEKNMRRKTSYFWMLTAFRQDGTKIESSLEQFELID